MTCGNCSKPLTERQAAYCSRACANAGQGYPVQAAVLAILQQTTHTWMSLSDLAYWTYGRDTARHRATLRMTVFRLRRKGHVMESRTVTWQPLSMGDPQAYRLIAAVQEVAA